MSDIEQVLKILSKAIVRETAAFNYYYRQSEGEGVPAGVKGLLTRLAEEERTHRRLLMNEYVAIEKGWNEDWDEERGSMLSYPIPDRPVIRDIEVSPCLKASSISLPAALLGGDNTMASVIKDKDKKVAGTFITLYDVMGHGIETTEINGLANGILGEYMDSARGGGLKSEALQPRN
ncbi:MAG TPA: hypothetical protein VLA34_03640, partial [Candidatus Krumholzibacterium sp.]|nr:hypothetical protein [Candidatus Krumholzibacterium sp.]